MSPIDTDVQQCIDNCQKCHSVCLSMATRHCLEMGGPHTEATHFRLMLDCAQVCATTADFMLRSSVHHAAVCAVCATICEDCAVSCELLHGMEPCVDACRACAESCSEMADMA